MMWGYKSEGAMVIAHVICLALVCSPAKAFQAEWPNHGGGIKNWREADDECKISPKTAPHLIRKWTLSTGGDVTATPAIASGVIYFPTWSGELFAVNKKSGSLIWQKNLTQLLGSATIHISRHTPVVDDKYLLVGIYTPVARLLALERRSGDLIWSKLLDANPFACITMSGTIYKRAYYVGVSSLSEVSLAAPTFQGSMVRVDIKTGNIIWRTKMLPDNGGKGHLYSGAALWGSSPPVDVKRNLVFIATGNLYSVPPDVQACQLREANKTVPDNPNPCIQAGDHSESILALDLDTGRIIWAHHLGGVDVWNVACLSGSSQPNCPPASGPDYDFGEAPMLLTVHRNKSKDSTTADDGEEWQDIVVAGQKSGFVWALDCDDGHIVWDAVAGPGGVVGGASWGSATDGERVYTSIINNNNLNFTLVPTSVIVTSGGWVAINSSSGVIHWSIATPDESYPLGPVSVANGVVFGTTLGAPTGPGSVYALDSKSGDVLWKYKANASLAGGLSIHDGCVFLGEGLTPITKVAYPTNTIDGHVVHAFCVDE